MRTEPKPVEGFATFDMRHNGFSAGKTRARLRQARLFTLFTTLYDFDFPLVAEIRALERRSHARINLDLLQLLSLSTSGASFNLNAYDDATALGMRRQQLAPCFVDSQLLSAGRM
jgi:hypothetical protein